MKAVPVGGRNKRTFRISSQYLLKDMMINELHPNLVPVRGLLHGQDYMGPISTLCWSPVRNFAIPQPLTWSPAGIARKQEQCPWSRPRCGSPTLVRDGHNEKYRFGLNLVPTRDPFGPRYGQGCTIDLIWFSLPHFAALWQLDELC